MSRKDGQSVTTLGEPGLALGWAGRRRAVLAAALAAALAAGLVSGSLVGGGWVGRPGPAAAAPGAGSVCPAEGVDEAAALALARACGGPVRVASALSQRREVVANADGSLTARLSLAAQRVRRDGRWVAVDATVTHSGGMVAPRVAAVDVRFSAGGAGPMLTLVSGASRVELSAPWPLPAPTLVGASAVYPQVLPGVSLRLSAAAESFSQVLVVRDAAAAANPALARLRFGLTTVNATVRRTPAGGVEVRDAAGERIFGSGSALMWDSTPAGPGDESGPDAPPHQVRQMGLSVTGEALVLEPDLALLRGERTVYPVFLDPSLSTPAPTWWTNVNECAGNTNYWGAHTVMRVGNAWGTTCTWRAFMQFDVAELKGTTILSAGVSVTADHVAACAGAWEQLWHTAAVDPGTVTWNNSAGAWYSMLDEAWFEANEESCPDPDDPHTFSHTNVRTVVQSTASAWADHLTLGLRARYETDQYSWSYFHSNPTALLVTYNHAPTVTGQSFTVPAPCLSGSTSTLPRINPSLAGAGLALRAVVDDADGGTAQAQFEWWLKSGSSSPIGSHTTSPPAAVGTTFQTTVAAATFTHNQAYSWRVRGYDGTEYSPWSPWCEFVADTSPPAAPTVLPGPGNDLQFAPFGVTAPTPSTTAVVGRPTKVTFTPAGGTDSTIVGYQWGLNTATPDRWASAASNGTAVVTIEPTLGGGFATNELTVLAVDKAGNRSTLPIGHEYSVGFKARSAAGWWPTTAATGPIADATDVGNDMTLSGGAGLGYGTATFNGTGYAATAEAALDTSDSFTAAAWVRVTNGGDWRAIVSAAGSVASGFYLQYQPGTGRWRFALPTTDGANPFFVEVYSIQPAVLGVWYHVAGVYDIDAGEIRLYVDGVLQGSVEYADGHWAATGVLQIGRTRYNSFAVNHMVGDIADVRVWQAALDAAGIAALAALPPAAGAWTLDDPASFTAADLSRLELAHPVSLTGGAVGSAGHSGHGLLAPAAGAAGTTSGPVLRTDGSFTVSAWVYLTDTNPSSYRTAISQDGGNVSGFFLLKVEDRWSFTRVTSDSTSTGVVRAYSTALYQANTWVHLSGVYNASTSQMSLYVNGAHNSTATCSACAWPANGALAIGRSKWGGLADWWLGKIDDVRVYSGALSAAQVARLPTL